MILTHKTECFPNKEQGQFLEQNFGVRRFIFNKTIMYLKHKYGDLKENKKLITKKEVESLRKTLFRNKYSSIVKTASSHLLDTAVEDVMYALDSLWRKGQNIQLRKKKYSNTCRFHKKGSDKILVSNGIDKEIRLPSPQFNLSLMNSIVLAEPLRWKNADIKTVTVKKQAGRYFISISCEIPDIEKPINKNRHIGIDWGLSTYITGYDGENILTHDFEENKLRKHDKIIAKYQHKLSKKRFNSNNFKKVTTKLQQAYLDFNNYRIAFIQETVNYLADNYDSITLEDLRMRFVTSNRGLAHRAKQKPFYLLKNCLINKFSKLGKLIYKVPNNYPSTQTCNSCGYVKKDKEKLKLGEKMYNCPLCGSIHNRDENAAMNLFNYRNLELAVID